MARLNLTRSRVQYIGHFREPAFAMLGNPAPLYTAIIERLRPFGAKVSSLSINLAVLAEANVACILDFGFVRVWLDRLEIVLGEAQSAEDMGQILKACWQVLEDTDPRFLPVSHDVVVNAWGKFEDVVYAQYISQFVTTPSSLSTWAPEVKLNSGTSSFHVAESAESPGGLYFQLRTSLTEPTKDPGTFIDALGSRLQELLRAFDLDTSAMTNPTRTQLQ
jgi:hypothetical protein